MSDICSNALDGMHPLLRHTPPKLESFSISVTFTPKSAALNAQAYPHGPDPITTSSWIFSLIF